MRRSLEPEILDSGMVPFEATRLAYRQLTWTHRVLGDTRAVVRALGRSAVPVRRVLDVGCGHGGLMPDIRALGVEVVGVDLRPPPPDTVPFPIVRADAVRDPLPEADAAVCVSLAHHLAEHEVVELIRNVGRSCRRLVLIDLVRHWLPLVLFRVFVAPALSPLNVADGCRSVRRAYTPAEMRAMVERALAGTGGRFHHDVAPGYVRQTVDITFRP